MSRASRLGYEAEHAVEDTLKQMGLLVWRPRAGAARDRGDIGGLPMVLSIKNRGKVELAEWNKDLQTQVVNAGVSTGYVIHKQRGKPLGDWFVTTNMRLWLPTVNALIDALPGGVVV